MIKILLLYLFFFNKENIFDQKITKCWLSSIREIQLPQILSCFYLNSSTVDWLRYTCFFHLK